jgi:hypothetical protein
MMFDILYFGLGVCVGAWGYRYYLKRDPAKLERWAAAINAKADALKNKL